MYLTSTVKTDERCIALGSFASLIYSTVSNDIDVKHPHNLSVHTDRISLLNSLSALNQTARYPIVSIYRLHAILIFHRP